MRWLSLLWLVVVSGCALMPAAPVTATRPAQPEAAPFALNGRVSISHQGKRNSAGLRWTHRAQSDEIFLLAPLGATAARIYRDAQSATLDDGGKHYQAGDAETLMQRVLGWHFPLNGMHYWVLGQASPESPAQIERDDNGQITLLRQNGWEVSYLRYADNLPSRMQISRKDLQVQLLIDEWEWNPQ